jgi:phosphohistidine phosphatase
MNLYLVQHGEALSSDEDATRPLSEAGARHTRRVGDYLYRENKPVIPEVLHSGKQRAAQTAELLAGSLHAFFVAAAPDLNPNDDPGLWAERLETRDGDLMLVGHLPHLQRLAGLLLSGDSTAEPVRFTNSCVICLEHDAKRSWHLKWAMSPNLLPD